MTIVQKVPKTKLTANNLIVRDLSRDTVINKTRTMIEGDTVNFVDDNDLGLIFGVVLVSYVPQRSLYRYLGND